MGFVTRVTLVIVAIRVTDPSQRWGECATTLGVPWHGQLHVCMFTVTPPFRLNHYNTRVRAGLLTRSHWVRGFAAPLAYLDLAYYIGIKSVFMFFLQKSCWK